MSGKIQINRPSSESIPFKEDFKIIYTKDSQALIDEESKRNCRIVEFSREWSLREILITISKFEPEVYENLFVFVIEDKNFELPRKDLNKVPRIVELIFEFLIEFGESKKPLLLQLRSQAQNLTKVYFKDKSSTKFIDIQKESVNKSESFDDFSSFIWFFKNKQCQNFEDLVIQKIPKVKNFELIMKFLQTLELTEDFNNKLVLKCAAEGSKNDFLTAIDAKCDDKGKIMNFSAKSYLTGQLKNTSVISTAIRGSNKEVTHYLMKHCTDLIQQLPFEHQVEASTAAIETGQPEILFDLLQRSDFPFPKDFNPKLISDKRILKVIDDREKFYNAVAKEDKEAITKFINNNPTIKFGYDPMNESVMNNALRMKKFESFFYLKSHGFRAVEFDHFSDKITNDKEKKDANKFARFQRIENVKISHADKNKAVMLIATRTFIYCRQDVNENEEEYRKKIKDWYMDIYKVKFGSQLLEAASQCENLKLVFDFECDSVENVDVSASSATLGSTYPVSKWIFVGAKSSESQYREQQIKGVIAHEICHYVMRLVYQNNENPYYKDGDEDCQRFDAIATAIELMLFPQNGQEELEDGNLPENQSDEEGNEDIQNDRISDECAGIISTVYTCYHRKDFHPELIVRPVHIYAQFDNDEELTAYLVDKYKLLFDYFEQIVIPELEKFNLKQREKVKKFNEFVGVLCEIESLDYEFASLKDITSMIDSHLIIITTNVPKLLILNVYKHLDQTRKNMLEDQNVFIAPDILKNPYIIQEFKTIVNQKVNLNIFVDCSKGINPKIKSMIINESSNYIFIVSNDHYSKELVNIFKDIKLNVSEKVINYEWKDLAPKSQKDLLQTKVNFQNNSTISLYDLISGQINQIDQQETFEEFGSVIDEDIIELLINETEIKVNIGNVENNDVDVFYRPRNFIENSPNKCASAVSIQKYSEEQMISGIANKNYILISDIAGAGKSETVKKMFFMFGDHYSKYWITFIDLRQFVNSLRLVDESMNILKFLDEKILSQKTKFERNIFKKLYENGQVCLIFDEFDKISSKDQEIIVKLFRTFNCISSNKLWILTRDYCELIIKNTLKLDFTYKLDDFGRNYGIDLIASSWVLNEMEYNIKTQSRKELINQIKGSPNFAKYQENAQTILNKILSTDNHSFGSKLPQFYKMVAEIFKNNKYLHINFTILKVYAEYVKIQYEKWLYKNNENIRNQNKQSMYFKIHQLIAMEITFPKDLKFHELGWTDEEIIECNFLSKIGDTFVYHCDIFRDYFITHYMIRMLKKKGNKIENDTCIYMIQVLTTPKFKIVRMFLNEALSDVSITKCIDRKMENLSKRFCEHSDQLVNISQIFEENYEHIVNFLISMLRIDSKFTWMILSNNIDILCMHEKLSETNSNVQVFINEVFKADNLLENIIKIVFSKIYNSSIEIEIVKNLLKALERKKGLNFVKQALKLKDESDRNIIFNFVNINEKISQNFQTFIKFLESFLSKHEIIELLKQIESNGLNIIHIMVLKKNKEILKYLWMELKALFINYESLDEFEDLYMKKTKNILHFATFSNDKEYRETFWELILDEPTKFLYEKIKELITQKDINLNNFIHSLIINGNEGVTEFALQKLKEIFDRQQCQEILKCKGNLGRNLLHIAGSHVRDIKIFDILWTFYEESWDNIELFDIFKEVDEKGENVLEVAATSSTIEIFAFFIQKLEMISSQDKIKQTFMTMRLVDKITLELESKHQKSDTWKVIEKYLNSENRESAVVKNNKQNLNAKEQTSEKNCKIWLLIKNCIPADFELSKKLHLVYKILDPFVMNNDGISFYEIIWEHLLKLFDREELQTLLISKYDDSPNFIFNLVTSGNKDEIEFTLNQIKTNFSKNKFKEVLKTKGYFEMNLLQTTLSESKDIKVFKIVWETAQYLCESYERFLEILQERDKLDRNIFHHAVCLESCEFLEFIIAELESNISHEEIKNLLVINSFDEKSLLRTAAQKNTNAELHKALWAIMGKYFYPSEILKIVQFADKLENSFLSDVVYFNKKEIIEISLDAIEKMGINEDFKMYEYLTSTYNKGLNILQICACTKNTENFEFLCTLLKIYLSDQFKEFIGKTVSDLDRNILHHIAFNGLIEFHKILWKFLINTFENQDELYALLSQREKGNCNFLHIFVMNVHNEETIEFVFNKIKENLNSIQYKEIVKSKGYGNRNLLQITSHSQCVFKFKFLWNVFHEICHSDDEFTELFKNVDNENCNVLLLVVKFSIFNVFDFLIKELELILNNEEIKKLLNTIDNRNRNLLQIATYNNSRDFLKSLLVVLQNYSNPREICNMMKHTDEEGNNFLFNLVLNSTQDTIKSIWCEIEDQLRINGESELKYLKSVNNDGENILHILIKVRNITKLKFLWVKIGAVFDMNKSYMSTLIDQKCIKNNLNPIQLAAKSNDVKFLESLWDLLTEIYFEKVENFIFQNEGKNSNIHFKTLIETNLIPKKLVTMFQDVASKTMNYERYKILWTFSRKIFKSDNEFLLFLQEQKLLFNVFKNIFNFRTVDIIEFTIKELEEIATIKQIRDILRQLDDKSQNLLQQSIAYRTSIEFYEHLWNVFHKFFNLHEILNIINNSDESGNNLLFTAVKCRNKIIINYTWEQIQNILMSCVVNEIECLRLFRRSDRNILHFLVNTKDEDILNNSWEKLKELFFISNYSIIFRNLFSERFSNEMHNVLQLTVFCDRIEFHKSFWKHLLDTFENREELKKLIFQMDKNLNNFIHLLVMYSKNEIIAFIFNNIKNNFSVEICQEIFKLKRNCGKNLLQLAVCYTTDINTIQFLIEFIDHNKDDLIENLTNVDMQSNNIFHLAACFSSSTILLFLIEELQKSTSNKNVRVILSILGFAKQNLLQKAAVQNTSLEFHIHLWAIMRMFLNSSDILEMVNHFDEYGHNLLLSAVKYNSKEVVELNWETIKMYIDKREDQVEYLDSVGYLDKNLRDLSLENQVDSINMRIYVQNLLMEYRND